MRKRLFVLVAITELGVLLSSVPARAFNQDDLNILQQTGICAGCNLIEANLSGAILEGTDLSGAYLFDAILRGTDLRGASLSGARLEGASLSGADLEGANLSGANLQEAKLDYANLEGANLEGANLKGADLFGTILAGANLRGADLEGAYLFDASPECTEECINLRAFHHHQEELDLAYQHTSDIIYGTILSGATYDETTLFPDGFDPTTHGLVFLTSVPEPTPVPGDMTSIPEPTSVVALLTVGGLTAGLKRRKA